jgi:hypothetical protein
MRRRLPVSAVIEHPAVGRVGYSLALALLLLGCLGVILVVAGA